MHGAIFVGSVASWTLVTASVCLAQTDEDVIVNGLRSPNVDVQKSTIAKLLNDGATGRNEVATGLRGILVSAQQDVAFDAALALIRENEKTPIAAEKSRRVVRVLVKTMLGDDPAARKYASKRLADFPYLAIPVLPPTLTGLAGWDSPPELASSLLWISEVCGNLRGSQEVFDPILLGYVRRGTVVTKQVALWGMVRSGCDPVWICTACRESMHDDNPMTRYVALAAMAWHLAEVRFESVDDGEFWSAEIEKLVVDALNDSDALVRMIAASYFVSEDRQPPLLTWHAASGGPLFRARERAFLETRAVHFSSILSVSEQRAVAPDEVLPYLTDALRESMQEPAPLQSVADGPDIAARIASTLGTLSDAARSAIPLLRRLAKSKDDMERCVAESALVRIDPSHYHAFALEYQEGLSPADSWIRIDPSPGHEFGTAVEEGLSSNNPWIREECLKAVIASESGHHKSRDTIKGLLNSADSSVRATAAPYLELLDVNSQDDTSVLRRTLDDDDAELRIAAAAALVAADKDSQLAVRKLRSVARNSEVPLIVRLRALATLPPGKEESVLLELVARLSALDDPFYWDADEAVAILTLLRRARHCPDNALAAVLDLLSGPDASVESLTSVNAVRTLGTIGSREHPVPETLTRLITRGSLSTRLEAIRTTERLGVREPNVIKALKSAAANQNQMIHDAAAKALDRLAPED